jgi:hypothetical protein
MSIANTEIKYYVHDPDYDGTTKLDQIGNRILN